MDVPFEGNNIEVQDAFDFDCDDTSLCEIIRRNLDNKIDALFVPLCFGETLSDFMGLRLAMMIRFSTNPNKLTPIIIYGEASYTDLLDLECFDILKMPGVSLVHSDFSSLQATAHTWKDISNSAYSAGLKNIHLHIPSDIGDNHSLSNKWAIHRWATAMNISEENDFDKVEAKVSENLYFRYLSALNSLKNAIKVNQKDMTIQKDSSNPKILLVDDQADEGWYEIMCHILYDINNIEFDCIGYYGELKAKTSDEIIELVKSKVESKNPDIVILDLRLCNSDYNTSKVKDMCGNKLLRKIKQHNRGIQVLMFSATNKVWNYQYLLNSEDDVDGADGFIIKEKPEDSVNVYFTKEVIKLFVASVTKCCQLTYRKALWVDLQNDLIKCSCSNSEYANFVFKLLELAQESLFAKQTNYTCASVFMNFFRVIEATANQYIDSYAKVDEETGQYYFLSKDGKPLWRFNTNDSAEPTETLLLDKKSLPYYQKICNTLMLLGAYSTHAYDIVKKRNAFEHPNADWQDSLQEFDISDVQNVFEIVHQLIQNQDNI